MFEPTNELEQSLLRAASDPPHRPQFFRDLRAADVILSGQLESDGSASLRTMSLEGRTAYPFFTSLARLEAVLDRPGRHLRVQGEAFLEMTRGETLVLNPGSPFGKVFHPAEVAEMLDTPPAEQHTVPAGAAVRLGEPGEYPAGFVEGLRREYGRLPQVASAYLRAWERPGGGPPTLLVGVEADGGWDEVMAAGGGCARALLPAGTPADFVRLPAAGLEDVFATAGPFYTRRGHGSPAGVTTG